MKKSILMLIVIGFLSVSIHARAGWFTEDYSAVNGLIAEGNVNRFKAFAEGMAACRDNAACQAVLSLAYGAQIGTQPYYKPESTSDLLRALLPYADLGVGLFRLYRAGTNGDSSGFVVTGNGNTFTGIGNKISSQDRSSATASFSTAVTTGNRTYTLGGDTDPGEVSDDGVTIYPDPTTESK